MLTDMTIAALSGSTGIAPVRPLLAVGATVETIIPRLGLPAPADDFWRWSGIA
jgi:hypothetical protein